MKSLALLLLILNMVFLTWQLELLSWQIIPKPSNEPESLALNNEHNSPNLINSENVDNYPDTTVETATNMASLSAIFEEQTTSPRLYTVKANTEAQPVAGLSTARVDNETANHPSTPSPLVKPESQVSEPDESSKPLTCFQAGPYTQVSMEGVFFNWLKNKQNISIDWQNSQTQVLSSTWIYLPPFESPQAAKRALKQLKETGIKDHYIVTKGKFKNAISLGLYKNTLYIKPRLDNLNAKGYNDIKTQKRYKTDTNYWLNVKMPADQNELIDVFKKQFEDLALVSVSCA